MHSNMNLFVILWNSGLVVKLVLLLLIIASVYSWAIIIQKNKLLKRVEKSDKDFWDSYRNLQGFSEIQSRADELTDSCLGAVFGQGYSEFSQIKEKILANGSVDDLKLYLKDHGIDALERSLQHGVNVSSQKLEDKLSILASVSSVAPFIGLFGTVWGIIDSFTGLAQGGGSIEAVAPGIAEALVATAVGLAAAIPANWAYNIFSNKIQRKNIEMENFGQDFLNMVERNILINQK